MRAHRPLHSPSAPLLVRLTARPGSDESGVVEVVRAGPPGMEMTMERHLARGTCVRPIQSPVTASVRLDDVREAGEDTCDPEFPGHVCAVGGAHLLACRVSDPLGDLEVVA